MIALAESSDVLLLDTHVWIWAFHAEASKVARELPNVIEAASRAGRLRLSAVSVWEASSAILRGWVPIRGSLDEWLDAAVKAFGGHVRPIDRDVALESVRLPGLQHRDPGDRFLIATARLMGARLVTADAEILKYGATGQVAVLDARP